MFDELFEGSAIKKWQEIILHANPSVVSKELERILEELARAELQREGIEENPENLEKAKQDLAIHSMGNILSRNE